jgi:hypothetical protein
LGKVYERCCLWRIRVAKNTSDTRYVGIILQRERAKSDVPFDSGDVAIVVAGIVTDAGDVAIGVYCGAQNPTPMP